MSSISACCFVALWFFLLVVPVTKVNCERTQEIECHQISCIVSLNNIHWAYWNCMCHDDCHGHCDGTCDTVSGIYMCFTENLTPINCNLEEIEFHHNVYINCTFKLTRSCCYNGHCCHDYSCCHEDIPISTQCSYCYNKPDNSSTDLKIPQLSTVYSHTILTSSVMRSTATSLPSTIATPYTSAHPVPNNTSTTTTVASLISGVLAVPLFLLILIVIGSILACTLYRRRAKRSAERHQYMHGQISMPQRMENTYCAHIPTQSTDAVYSLVHEEDTETTHHNTVLPPPTYSSLAPTQLQDVNEQGTPSEYSVITLENISNSIGQTQNPVAPAGVGAGTVYSTVVRQDGKKVTIKLDTSHTHAEEKEPGVQKALSHGHTSSVEFPTNTSHATEEEGAQDIDYLDDPDILQQIRAQKP